MKEMKVRMELHLEAGDRLPEAEALADALEGHLAILRLGHSDEPPGVVDVPRGKLAYSIEVKHVR